MPPDITDNLLIDGFVFIRSYLPTISGVTAFSGFGRVIHLPDLSEVQVLTPRNKELATPNTYSGHFGLEPFPLHTDMAHWYLPPRYIMLRCIAGTQNVTTRLVDSKELISVVGRRALQRVLVRPRRPIKHNCPLLRLLTCQLHGYEIFRWDSLFVTPTTPESQTVYELVAEHLASFKPTEICLENRGDTLIVDNWRLLHGRSEVLKADKHRRVERAYLGDII